MKTLAQKLEILDKIKLGYTYQGISDEYGIAKSAITFIKKNEAKYRELSKNYPDTMRRAPSDKVIKIDSEIKEFLRESNQSNKPLSKSLIQEFAKEKHEMNGITNFRGSNGYIFRLAKRLNMKNSNNKTPPATSKPKNPPKKVTKSGAMSSSSQASTQKRQILRYKKLTPNATRPTRASRLSAGLDLCSAYDVLIPSKGKALVKTDLQVRIPDECYGRIVQRSDLALEHFIIVGAGVIDADYRGNVGVALFNLGETDFHVHKGDKIAQLICERICYPLLQEFREDQEL